MAFAVAKLEREIEIEREREQRSRTHLDRLEDIHARMPGVALLALVPGLARGALLAANAVESLCEIVRHLSKAGSRQLAPTVCYLPVLPCRQHRPSCHASLAYQAVQVDQVDLQGTERGRERDE